MICLWQFCFSVPSEYVHNYDVSSMTRFKNLVFCTWLVRIFSVPDRYLYYKEVSVYKGGLNLGFLYLVIQVFWDESAMMHLQFGFSVPSEYVHNYDVSAMMCFRIVFSVPDWYVYFPVPDR